MNIVTLKKWGNSAGFVIPADEIKAAKAYVGEKFELHTQEDGVIILKPLDSSRAGWLEAINNAPDHDVDHDTLNLTNEFDDKEWTW